MGVLNPTITKETNGNLTLRWTKDPQAKGYLITTPSGTSTAGANKTSANLGLHDSISVSISSLYPQAPETAVYPPPPPVTHSVTSHLPTGTLTGSVIWTATASPAPSKVEFSIDGSLKWTENVDPYVFNGDGGSLDTTTLSNGTHVLSVKATFPDAATATQDISVTVDNTVVVVPPPATGLASMPGIGWRYGGMQSAAQVCSMIAASFPSQIGDARPFKASNPLLKGVFAQMQLTVGSGHSTSFTYGDDARSAPGWQASFNGYVQRMDGIRGFKLDNSTCSAWLRDSLIGAWNRDQLSSRGYDGIWSDNVFFSGIIHAGWCYNGDTIDASAWDHGLGVDIHMGIRNTLHCMAGGNVSHHGADANTRPFSNLTMIEDFQNSITDANSFQNMLNEIVPWQQAKSGGPWFILAKQRNLGSWDANKIRYGWYAASLIGACWMGSIGVEDDWHGTSIFPSDLFNARGQWGTAPVGGITRSGNRFQATFSSGKTIWIDTGSHTFGIA